MRNTYPKRGNYIRGMSSCYAITEEVSLTQHWRNERIRKGFLEEAITERKEGRETSRPALSSMIATSHMWLFKFIKMRKKSVPQSH